MTYLNQVKSRRMRLIMNLRKDSSQASGERNNTENYSDKDSQQSESINLTLLCKFLVDCY